MNEAKDNHRHTVLLHDTEELDDDLGAGADQDLALASLLGVVDGVKRIVENGSLHLGGVARFSRRGVRREVSDSGSQPSAPVERKECPSAQTTRRVLQLGRVRCRGVEVMTDNDRGPWLPEGHIFFIATYLRNIVDGCL